MFKILVIGFSIVAINVVLQALTTTYWVKSILRNLDKWHKEINKRRMAGLLIFSFFLLTLLHTIQALIWAAIMYQIPLIQPDFANFWDTFYFSIVTFTTLGYGDMTISSEWKLLSGIEAINGIMLIAWSTALMYSLIQNIFRTIRLKNE